jgi:hypothetical protein
MIEITDKIKAEDSNAIIVIAGDHGSRVLYNSEHNRESLNSYQAYYFPKQNYTGIHDSLNIVNAFRFVLNNNFNAELPILTNKQCLAPQL